MLDFRVSVFEPIQIEQKKVFIFDFLANSNMVASGRYCNALDRLYLI